MTSDGDSTITAQQQDIIRQLGVTAGFDVQAEADHRTAFLAQYLQRAGLRTFVVGVSGGVDSLVAGQLARGAVRGLRKQGYEAHVTALRLPYGIQPDEDDALACLDVIQPDEVLTVDIQSAADALMAGLVKQGLTFKDATHQDFILGNIKARERMVALYAVAGAQSGLVVGTDHAAEMLTGFSTKFGDTAADVMPLHGLNKRRVRALAQHLGAPDTLSDKVPTADLESLAPMRPDEEAFGVSYHDIDDFLEGKTISPEAHDRLLGHWRASAHKRGHAAVPAAVAEV